MLAKPPSQEAVRRKLPADEWQSAVSTERHNACHTKSVILSWLGNAYKRQHLAQICKGEIGRKMSQVRRPRLSMMHPCRLHANAVGSQYICCWVVPHKKHLTGFS